MNTVLDAVTFKLSPSDLTFTWEECHRCFYLKVVHGFNRPRTPMPKIFIKIDGIMKECLGGISTEEISEELPPGKIILGDSWVKSAPISVPGHDARCFIRGRIDSAMKFADGTYGLVDFKTADPNDAHVPLYTRQLHAYAFAVEDPASERDLHLPTVSRMGLLAVNITGMHRFSKDTYAYSTKATWIECERDDDAFLGFLGEVLDVLKLPEPPEAGPRCEFCRYRG